MFVAAAVYTLLSSALASFLLTIGVHGRRRWWPAVLLQAVLVISGAALAELLTGEDVWLLLLILAGSQAWLFGLRSELHYLEVAGDPAAREQAGDPQLGGRSRRYWTFWLNVSPWHVRRYRRLRAEYRGGPPPAGQQDSWYQRVGTVGAGPHRGMFVEVEQDESRTGWHIWLSAADPRLGPSGVWDIWADTLDDVEEWLSPAHLDVRWID